MAKQSIIPSGSLDLENNILAIKPNDYRDALDISALSDGNGNTIAFEPVLGCTFSDDLGSVFAQAKVMRIQLATGAGSYSLIFKRLNYITIATVTIAQNASAATTVANAIAAITAAIPEAVIVASSNANVTVDVSIANSTLLNYWDWVIYNNSSTIATFTTLQEAIDAASAGNFKPIGSFDLLGTLFKWGATNAEVPSNLPIASVSDDGGRVKLEVLNHGLINGAAISVQGVTDNSGNSLAGEWIVQSATNGSGQFDSDRFILYGSTYDAPYVLDNAQVTINLHSVGCITVVQENIYNNTISNISLLQSKALNLRVKRMVDTYVENDSRKINLYFTDGLNPIRVLYYEGAYVTNGFLNNYTYDTIGEESRLLIQDTNITLTYDSTSTGVGQLKSGDYRYAVRFITENESASSWTQLSNVINIYGGTNYIGDVDGTVTSRSNTFSVSNIPTGLFKYVELAYVIYQGEANAAFLASRTVITSTTMQLTHTGFEAEQEVDLGTLQSAYAGYETAESIDVLNNKMIISNLTTNQIKDFSEFAQTFTHALSKDLIPNVGVSVSTAFDNYKFGEYFDTRNTFYKKTFVDNETYRFGLQVKLKNGPLLPNIFWIDDICFNTSANNNLANPTSNRRTAGLPNYNLVDFGGTENIFVTRCTFGNIDWNFTIDGVRIIDLVERIYINQVEMTSQYKEILGTGLAVSFARFSGNCTTTGNDFGAALANAQLPEGWATGSRIGEFNWFSGNTELVNGTVGTTFPNTYTDARVDKTQGVKYVSFYSPDDYFNNEAFELVAGDKLLQFTEADRALISTNQTSQGYEQNAFKGQYEELLGSNGNTFTSVDLQEVQQVPAGGEVPFNAGAEVVCKNSWIGWEDNNLVAYTNKWNTPASPVLRTQTFFITTTKGHFYAQYYRPKGYYIKFGDKTESKYVPTGAYVDAPVIGSITTVVVYGDSFTQSSFYKIRASDTQYTPFGDPAAPVINHFYVNGWGFETMFYSQNRVNSQMRYATSGVTGTIAPFISIDQWNNFSSFDITTTSYTPSYTPRNNVNVLPAYDPNAIDTTQYPTRIAYSQTKPNGSVTDEYRDFKPLDFRDLDMVNGEIIHHEVVNSELLTWQQRAFMRQYFNSNGLITNNNGTEVILGDGAALSRRGVQLSSLGTTHKWSIVKGVSKGGNDVMAWWNTEYGYIVRFGYDGVNPISYVHNINGFVDKNTKWVEERTTPADQEGIRGVWHDERKEYLWTIMGYKANKQLFNPRKYYNLGDTVFVRNGTQNPFIYEAIQDTRTVETTTYPPISIFVNNGDFSAGLGFWTQSGSGGGGWTAVTGAAKYTNNGTTNFFGAINQVILANVGQTYDVTFTVQNFTDTSGNLELLVWFSGNTTPNVITANGTYTLSILCESNPALLFSTISNGAGDSFEITGISVNSQSFTSTISSAADITDAAYWRLVTEPSARNEYTLAFSEYKNGFSCFHSFLPLFYARWKKSFQGSSQFSPSLCYNFNRGEYASWYDGQLKSTPYIQMVMNANPFDKKSFDAIELNTKFKPNDTGNAMEFLTEQHYSYLVYDDFDSDELHDIMYASWIKNDATITAENPNGLNDIDTSRLFGEYLLAKFIFKQGVYNSLFGATIKFTPRTRLNTT